MIHINQKKFKNLFLMHDKQIILYQLNMMIKNNKMFKIKNIIISIRIKIQQAKENMIINNNINPEIIIGINKMITMNNIMITNTKETIIIMMKCMMKINNIIRMIIKMKKISMMMMKKGKRQHKTKKITMMIQIVIKKKILRKKKLKKKNKITKTVKMMRISTKSKFKNLQFNMMMIHFFFKVLNQIVN